MNDFVIQEYVVNWFEIGNQYSSLCIFNRKIVMEDSLFDHIWTLSNRFNHQNPF